MERYQPVIHSKALPTDSRKPTKLKHFFRMFILSKRIRTKTSLNVMEMLSKDEDGFDRRTKNKKKNPKCC